MHHQSIKTKKVSKDNSTITHLVRTVCELKFSIIQTHYKAGTLRHSDAFSLFTSAKVVPGQRLHNIFSKRNTSCVLLWLMLTRPFLNSCCLHGVCFLGFLHSSSSASASCSHTSPTASNSNLPSLKMANFRKVFIQSRYSLVEKKNFFF